MFPALYAILDASPEFAGPSRFSILEIAERLAGARVELFQYRDKRGSARKIRKLRRRWLGGLRMQVRRAIHCERSGGYRGDGGGGRRSRGAGRPSGGGGAEILGSGLWVGVSTHNLEQLRAADATSADYIAVGPIFRTGTKENPDPVVGFEFLRAARKLRENPLWR